MVLLLLGLPVAFAFLTIDIIGAYFFFGGIRGVAYLVHSIYDSITTFTLLPLVLFIIMGEVMFHSGIGFSMIDALERWMRRIPGRLSLMAVGGGTLLSVLSGSSTASVAVLGSTLLPEMQKRGYKAPMSVGPILGSGGLAVLIPPSIVVVFFAAVAEVSVGKLLVAIAIPGILIALAYAMYIIIRCKLQPDLAVPYEVEQFELREKIYITIRHILPLGIILFLVLGTIFLGIATPSEAAGMGAFGSFLLAALQKSFNFKLVKKTAVSSLKVTVMIMMIIAGAKGFSQILAMSQVSRGLSEFAAGLPLSGLAVVVAMQLVLIFLGMFIGTFPIIMICAPLFLPIIIGLGFDPLWFSVLFLINAEVSLTTPPFGINLFVMKGVAPPNITMGAIYWAGLPFVICDLIIMALILIFPQLALFLTDMMH
jgi:tripartite ATP-independent transporter DctM subunit